MAAGIEYLEGLSFRGSASRGTGSLNAGLARNVLFGCSALVGLLALAAVLVPSARPPVSSRPSVVDPVALPAWIAIDHPLQQVSLAGSAYARLHLDYEARRRLDGAGRQDTLTFGTFSSTTPFLRLSLQRGTRESASDLLVSSARLAGTAGIAVLRAGQPDAISSRLGLFAAAPMTLGSTQTVRPCLGFRLEGRPSVEIAGLACGLPGHVPDRANLACALDRLELERTSGDAVLQAFFDAAERRRGGDCDAIRLRP